MAICCANPSRARTFHGYAKHCAHNSDSAGGLLWPLERGFWKSWEIWERGLMVDLIKVEGSDRVFANVEFKHCSVSVLCCIFMNGIQLSRGSCDQYLQRFLAIDP